MATPSEKLAESLQRLHKLQNVNGASAIRATWTVIPLSERKAYMAALEKASMGEDIGPFADFLAKLVEKRLAGEPLPAVPTGSSR